MASDRFIYWRETVPTAADIGLALLGYLGGGIGEVAWHEDHHRWYVRFPGASTHPQRHFLPGGPDVTMRTERFFEVCLGHDHIDVITRDQSPLINAIADGFADWAQQFWHASPVQR